MHILKILLHTSNDKIRSILKSYGHELVNKDYTNPDYIICYRTYSIIPMEVMPYITIKQSLVLLLI